MHICATIFNTVKLSTQHVHAHLVHFEILICMQTYNVIYILQECSLDTLHHMTAGCLSANKTADHSHTLCDEVTDDKTKKSKAAGQSDQPTLGGNENQCDFVVSKNSDCLKRTLKRAQNEREIVSQKKSMAIENIIQGEALLKYYLRPNQEVDR